MQETRHDWYKLAFDQYCMFAFILCCPFNYELSNKVDSYSLGGELFMHLEREGIFMEDTAW